MSELARIPALILAGGYGMRLQSVISDRPKALALVNERPFLHRILEQLDAAGTRRAILCTGYLGDQIERMLGSRFGGMALEYSREASPLGTAGALRRAIELTSAPRILAMNGDSFCPVDLEGFVMWHKRVRSKASLVLTEVGDTGRFGRVECDASGRVIRFSEKASGPSEAGWINAGIYLIERSRLLALPRETELSLERAVFPQWLADGMFGFPGPRRFLDIGTPESYARAPAFFAANESDLS